MAIVKVEQRLEEALLALAPPWWGKPRIAALLASYINRLQALEDDFFDILEQRDLATADLVRLKVLGSIVGQPRLSFSTEDFRRTIQARALANVSRGRASDMFAVLEVLVGPGLYSLIEIGDATLYLIALQPITDGGVAMITAVIPDTRPAGVGLKLFRPIDADVDGLTWGSSVDPGLGGDLDSSVSPIADTPQLYSVRSL